MHSTRPLVVPNKEDFALFRRAVGQKYKVIMFLIPNTDKVVYFFCKTEAGIKRRIENLLTNDRRKTVNGLMQIRRLRKLKYPKINFYGRFPASSAIPVNRSDFFKI